MTDWVRHTVLIKNNLTGEVVEHIDDYGDKDDDVFIWEEGNNSCDCNRILYFYRAKGLSEDEIDEMDVHCTGDMFSVVSITNAAGKIIYSETCEFTIVRHRGGVSKADSKMDMADKAEQLHGLLLNAAAYCDTKVERPAGYWGQWKGYGDSMGDKTGPECAAYIRKIMMEK